MQQRKASVERNTKETQIKLDINLDGSGVSTVSTGIGFFDHMLDGFARHGFFDLKANCKGDLHVDCHHTVEDFGIVLGTAISKALGDKTGIRRYGSCILPMDEALVTCAVDLSGRPYFSSDVVFPTQMIGDFDTQMIQEFFYAIAYSSAMNLHFMLHRGENSHHIAEACFKAFAKALDSAASYEARVSGVLSTKEVL